MSTTPQTSNGEAPLQGGMLWLAAIVLAMANFVAVLDMTIANVAMPSIAGSLGISSSQGTWIITSYAVAEAIAVPLTGWLASRFGAVRVFTSAMMLFGAFSALCGFATSLGMLVFGRVMQGLSGGLLMPLSQTLLLKIFPKERAAAAMALWAMTTLVAPVVGPILGGWLCESYAWPIIFFINVPLAFAFSPIILRMTKRYEEALIKAPMDYVGLVLMVVFVGALQLMLDLGKEHDWFSSWEICALAVIAVIGFVAFVIWELTEQFPVVDLRIFRHRGFTACVLTITLGFGAVFAGNVLVPLWLQSYMGYTQTMAGLVTGWSGVLAVFGAPIAGALLTRFDPRKMVFLALLWLGGVMVMRAYATTDMTYWSIVPPLILTGAALPFFFLPLTTLALASVEEKEIASAAGLQNFLRTLSGAVATSVVTTTWEDNTNVAHAELSGMTDTAGEAARALENAGFSPMQVLQQIDNMVTSQSVMLATNQVNLMVAVVFVMGAFMVWFAPKPTRTVDMTKAGH